MKSYKTIWMNGRQIRLHRYVMECFLGRPLLSSELVHHKDGDRFNNDIKNLEITTRKEHAIKHQIGKKTRFKNRYKLNDKKVLLFLSRNTYSQTARKFGCSIGAIQNVEFRYNKKYS